MVRSSQFIKSLLSNNENYQAEVCYDCKSDSCCCGICQKCEYYPCICGNQSTGNQSTGNQSTGNQSTGLIKSREMYTTGSITNIATTSLYTIHEDTIDIVKARSQASSQYYAVVVPFELQGIIQNHLVFRRLIDIYDAFDYGEFIDDVYYPDQSKIFTVEKLKSTNWYKDAIVPCKRPCGEGIEHPHVLCYDSMIYPCDFCRSEDHVSMMCPILYYKSFEDKTIAVNLTLIDQVMSMKCIRSCAFKQKLGNQCECLHMKFRTSGIKIPRSLSVDEMEDVKQKINDFELPINSVDFVEPTVLNFVPLANSCDVCEQNGILCYKCARISNLTLEEYDFTRLFDLDNCPLSYEDDPTLPDVEESD